MDKFQQSLLDTISLLTKNEINKIQRDKTIVGQIKYLNDPTTNKYTINYNNGSFIAFGRADEVYENGETVYISVPLGDFNNTKYIVGKAYNEQDTQQHMEKVSQLNNYTSVCGNMIRTNPSREYFGLNIGYKFFTKDNQNKIQESVKNKNEKYLYSRLSEDKLININEEDIRNNISRAEVLYLSANFQTNFNQRQKRLSKGNYRLIVGCSFLNGEDENENIPLTIVQNYETQLSKIESKTNKSAKEKLQEIEKLIAASQETESLLKSNYGKTLEEIQQTFSWSNTDTQQSLTNELAHIFFQLLDIQKNTPLAFSLDQDQLLKALFKTIQQKDNPLRAIRTLTKSALNEAGTEAALNDEVLETLLENLQKNFLKIRQILEKVQSVRVEEFVLSSSEMSGNPFNFSQPTLQYSVFDIAGKDFLNVEYIKIDGDNGFQFKTTDGDCPIVLNEDAPSGLVNILHQPQIQISNINLTPLTSLKVQNGDYSVKLSTPLGTTFSKVNNKEEMMSLKPLKVKTEVFKKTNDVSDMFNFYWFRQNQSITPISEKYSTFGGAGWELIQSGIHSISFDAKIEENLAATTEYKVIVTYNNITMEQTFTIHNNNSKKQFYIHSDRGTVFSFGRGNPILTCLEENQPELLVNREYQWCVENNGSEIRLLDEQELNKTITKIKQEIKEGMSQNPPIPETQQKELVSKMTNLMQKKKQFKNISIKNNVLTYPVANMSSNSVDISCKVYEGDTFIGDASIELKNKDELLPQEASIVIVNGDQVFQYSEMGQSPASTINKNPIRIEPLKVLFYDASGTKISNSHYDVSWFVPLENTLVEVNKDALTQDTFFSSGKRNMISLSGKDSLFFNIADDFSYQKQNNQLMCVVRYKGENYKTFTNLTFTKEGNTGTNGTDFTCLVRPNYKATLNPYNEMVFVKSQNTDGDFNHPIFYLGNKQVHIDSSTPWKTQLFDNNKEIGDASQKVNYKIKGINLRNSIFTLDENKLRIRKSSSEKNLIHNQTIQARVNYEGKSYYGTCSLPYVHSDSEVHIFQDSLQDVVFNSNGARPLFNHAAGIHFAIAPAINIEDLNIKLFGGPGNENYSVFSTYHIIQEEDGSFRILLDVKDSYDGEWCNQGVYISWNGNYIYYPINCSLNTNELKSLNDWDGNKIHISEEDDKEQYILAPQIGAGEKDSENHFTGVVMGVAQNYDEIIKPNGETKIKPVKNIGLLGYAKGKQSIFLDAETGNATFGVKDGSLQKEGYAFNEGQIKLRPGGTSTIGSWSIGNSALYSSHWPQEKAEGHSQEDSIQTKSYKEPGGKYHTNTKYKTTIKPEAEGIMLSSNPTYLSVKGRPLTLEDLADKENDADNVVLPGDSLEVEINPKERSVFSIFRHCKNENNEWIRYPLVGINNHGQFYTNSLQDKDTTMTVGPIGAFGSKAADKEYVGSTFNTKSNTIMRFGIKTAKTPSKSTGETFLFIAGNSSANNMYTRPLKLYGKTMGLYANSEHADLDKNYSIQRFELLPQGNFNVFDSNNSIKLQKDLFEVKTTTNNLSLKNDEFLLTHKDNNVVSLRNNVLQLSLPSNEIILNNNGKTQTIKGGYSLTATGSQKQEIGGDVTENIKGNRTLTVGRKNDVSIDGDYNLNIKGANFNIGAANNVQLKLGGRADCRVYYNYRTSDSDAEWGITSPGGSVLGGKKNGSSQLDLKASEIVTGGHLTVNGNTTIKKDATAYNFYFSSAESLSYSTDWSKGKSRTKVWDLLQELSGQIARLDGRVNSTNSKIQNEANRLDGRINSTNSKFSSYATISWVNSKFVTIGGSSYKALERKIENHGHWIKYKAPKDNYNWEEVDSRSAHIY